MKIRIFLVLTLLLLIAGCSGKKGTESTNIDEIQSKEGVPVRVWKAEAKKLVLSKKYSGTLRGKQEANANSFIGGNLEEIPVQIGQKVSKDQIVAKFYETEAASSYRQAKAAFDNSKENLERYASLLSAGAISQQTYDNLKTQHDVAKANFEAAERQIFVKAPISGTVAEIYFRKGDNVQSGKPIVKITDPSNLTVRIQIPETDIQYVSKNTRARIYSNISADTTFAAHVEKISLTANENTRSFDVDVNVDNSKATPLRGGVVVEVELDLVEKPKSLFVSTENLSVNGDKKQLFIIDPATNKALLHEVHTGLSSGTIFEIIEGLAEGDLVVVEGASRLADGSLVKIVE